MVCRLQEQLSQSRTDTLIYMLRDYTNVRDSKGCSILDEAFAQTISISEWLALVNDGASIRRRMHTTVRISRQHAREFLFLVDALDLAMLHYSRLCESIENRLRGVLGEQKLVDDNVARRLKQAWNLGRENQGHLVRDWAAMGQEINDSVGFDLCIVHFPQLRPID